VYKGLAAALIIVGVILIIYGVNASNSFDSDVSRVFTGAPTDKTIWFLVGGVVASGVGLYGLFSGSKV
jgi:uncharacterized membrane protein YidH (DUF202 family)